MTRHRIAGAWFKEDRRVNAAERPFVERMEARTLLTGPTAPGQTVPTAHDDVIDTDEGNQVIIPVLANDSDPSGITFSSVTIGTQPTHGTILQIDPELGTITYNPASKFAGTDSFTYTFRDKFGVLSNAATVTVIVNRPVANDDFAQTVAGVPVLIAASDNDADPDGNEHLIRSSVAISDGPTHGSATPDGKGSFTYTPGAGFEGTDRFTYTIKDNAGATSNTGTVTIVVTAPPAQAGTFLNDDDTDTDEGNPVTVDILANDVSPIGFNPSTVAIVSHPLHGTATIDPTTGAITYNPAAQYFGTDTFTYTVKDQAGGIAGPGKVSIVVNRPTANDDFAETFGTAPITIPVLENDTDPDGNERIDPTSVHAVAVPAHGLLTAGNNGTLIYTAIPGFSGTDHFTYTIKDEAGATSNAATVTIVVTLGQVSGTVYTDYNLDGKQEAGELGLSGRVFYIDANHDGERQADELATSTDLDGRYTFKNLPAGNYAVLQDTGDDPTLVQVPQSGAATSATVTPAAPIAISTGVGNVTVSPISPVNLTPQPFPTGTSGATTRFVQGVYRSVVGADGSASQVASLLAKLGNAPKVKARTAVARKIWESRAHRAAEVAQAYQALLGRSGSAKEIGKLVRQFAAKGGEIGISAFLLSSKEFGLKAGNGNAVYVKGLYRTLLGRDASAAEVSGLTSKLDHKKISAATAAKKVLNSQDGAGLIIDSLYVSILQSGVDSSTRQALIDRLQSGRTTVESIGVGLLASSQYYARAARS